ncbi:L,D-peptidoglycan transpeptidase YkuD, ErfK/YbiS/YcfS/YnhG family [Pedococcus dokdonensis]|uniref:L,D-peptidoglycan transpeptidase YkuD, ErfK/YbiS/YcfS/YnhG family n=1 Tax=Pedococcus dokdonensis TaxID=443156 RepID=A0A1H0UH77_9MICO|nr:L,D-transpeptidase family protein [Pedococcus dokdonensis]SDP65430.1 L,D-peptidoglycan transpeptidase YkuD, ErfK/YbiS/YcfS/YnhG family [Pedococcus dokdonensis]
MSRSTARATALLSLPLVVSLVAACGGGDAESAGPTTAPSTSTTASSSSATGSTTTPTSTTTTTTTTSKPTPSTTTRRATPRPSPRPSPKPSPKPQAATCKVPSGVRAAQVVLVTSSGSSATVRACRRTSNGYVRELGPYYGHVGRNGVSWSKREGDLRTPAGTYPLRGGFGARANPGLAQGWFRVDGNDVWVDDSGSSLYNTHQRKPVSGRWDSAENLLNTPAYNYAQVIGYNESRTPGKGSAIFFHVDTGGGTAGCVSLPTSALLAVLRWERAGAVMSIS